MPKLIISKFDDGLVPRFWQGVTLARFGTEGMYASGVVNPLTQFGYLCPAANDYTALTNAASNTTGITKFVLVDDENIQSGVPSVYGGGGALIYGINNSSHAIVNTGEFPHTINATAGTHNGHTSETVRDIVLYQVNGSLRLCYFYTDSTDGDMGTYDLASSFTADDADEAAWSTASGGAVFDNDYDIVAKVADNGYMYVGNGNNLYRFDGTTAGGAAGTVSTALTFQGGWRVMDMADGRGYLWMAMMNSGTRDPATGLVASARPCAVAVWDRKSTSVSISDFVPIEGASKIYSIFFMRGVPHVLVQASEGIIELRGYENGKFRLIRKIGVSTSAPASRHAVNVGDDFISWLGGDGYVYIYGHTVEGQPDGLHRVGSLTVDSAGAMVRTGSTEFYIAARVSSAYQIYRWYMFATDQTAAQGNWYSKVYDLPKLSEITGMTVYYPPLSSGTNVNMNLEFYINSKATQENAASYAINYRDVPNGDGNRGFKYFPMNFSNVNACQIKIAWPTAPTVINSIRPYRIEIDYEVTKKKL